MRTAGSALSAAFASLILVALAGCNSLDCNTQIPDSCPPPQTVAEDAGVPDGMSDACAQCLSGATATCVETDGMHLECNCVAPCDD